MDHRGSNTGLSRRTLVIIIGALLVLAGVGGFRYASFIHQGTAAGATALISASQTDGAELAVHVKGAVAEPGLYRLPLNSRVSDAVEAAGGLLPEADLDRINLAALVTDGSQLTVPYAAGEDENAAPGETGELVSGPININTATLAQLQTLDGIGEVKAQAIIDYRESHGDFTSVEQLLRVSGIGTATLDKIRDEICAD